MNSEEIALIEASLRELSELKLPTAIELIIVKRIIPAKGDIPIRIPNDAPAKPISDKVCERKDIFLETTKTPTIPAVIAMKVLAIKAWRINSYSNILSLHLKHFF